jgi:hypothetical protein
MPRLAVVESGNFFFEPLQFHLEATDLLIQFGLEGFVFARLLTARLTKDIVACFEQCLLPLTHEVRVQARLARDFVDGLLALGRFQRDPEFVLKDGL